MLSLFWKKALLLNCRSNVYIQQCAHQNCCSMVSVVVTTLEYHPGSNLGQHTKIFQYFFLLFGYFRFYAYFFPLNWFFFLNIYRKKIIKKRYVLLIVKCFEHIFEPSHVGSKQYGAKWLDPGVKQKMAGTACVWRLLRTSISCQSSVEWSTHWIRTLALGGPRPALRGERNWSNFLKTA